MAFSINTNVNAMNANLNATMSSNSLDKSLALLAAGVKDAAASDAAGLSIANGMSAQVSGMGQAIQNSNESIGMLQVADGAMGGINDNMQRVRDLTIRASNGTMSDSDRASIQKEIDGLMKSTNDIVNSTSYNGINLLDGTGGSNADGTFVTQTGANAGETQSVTIDNVNSLISPVDVTTQEGRDAALNNIDQTMKNLSDVQSTIGSAQNQLASSVRNTYITQNNTAAAESQIRDVDFAKESANFSTQNLLSQAGVFAQSQANLSSASVSGLIA